MGSSFRAPTNASWRYRGSGRETNGTVKAWHGMKFFEVVMLVEVNDGIEWN